MHTENIFRISIFLLTQQKTLKTKFVIRNKNQLLLLRKTKMISYIQGLTGNLKIIPTNQRPQYVCTYKQTGNFFLFFLLNILNTYEQRLIILTLILHTMVMDTRLYQIKNNIPKALYLRVYHTYRICFYAYIYQLNCM